MNPLGAGAGHLEAISEHVEDEVIMAGTSVREKSFRWKGWRWPRRLNFNIICQYPHLAGLIAQPVIGSPTPIPLADEKQHQPTQEGKRC